MSTIGRRVCALVIIIVAVLSLAVIPSQASEAGCAPNIGERMPIVLVHGLSGKPDDWSRGKISMIDALKAVRGIYVGEESAFDYGNYNQEWVDNNNIGPVLARRIACLAVSSRQAGGPGKVVVIGHSMGGLATRYAAAQIVNGRKVSQDIGLVVTIGTPNTGSGWANAWSGALHHVICPARLLFGEHVSSNNSCALTAVSGLRNSSRQIQELAWNAGACGASLAGVNCNGIARLKFTVVGDGIRGTITSIRYQPWTDDPLPSDFVPPEGGYQTGDTMTLRLIAPGVLKRANSAGGNPYFCAESASEEWHFKCNA